MGLGPIGLMFVRLARYAYGARVIAIARRIEQVDRAMLLGAEEGILMGDKHALIDAVKDQTSGHGADVVIEAIGQPEAWELGYASGPQRWFYKLLRRLSHGTKVGLDTGLLHYSEITCRLAFITRPSHIRRALEYVAQGKVSARQLVNHEQPLSDLPKVLYDLAHRRNGQIKTAIIP